MQRKRWWNLEAEIVNPSVLSLSASQEMER